MKVIVGMMEAADAVVQANVSQRYYFYPLRSALKRSAKTTTNIAQEAAVAKGVSDEPIPIAIIAALHCTATVVVAVLVVPLLA